MGMHGAVPLDSVHGRGFFFFFFFFSSSGEGKALVKKQGWQLVLGGQAKFLLPGTLQEKNPAWCATRAPQ